MISKIYLENFKAFDDLSLDLQNLTLLTGLNSVGKSTVLQSLLVLRQSYLAHNRGDFQFPLTLKGNLVDLGNVEDVFHDGGDVLTSSNTLSLGLEDTTIDGAMVWRYPRPINRDFFDNPEIESDTDFTAFVDSALFSTSGSFQYIQAERIGPRVYTEASDSHAIRRELGKAGEYTIYYLDKHQEDHIPYKNLCFEDDITDDLLRTQVVNWMGTISPNTKIEIQSDRRLGLSSLIVNGRRATNVGFGISYVLPIIVAILSSRQGDLVLLENPEAHLHPQGQSRMGELIARAAAVGIQVIIETHSDHILNGIRVATRKQLVNAQDIALHFFDKRPNEPVDVHSPTLDQDGRIDYWPNGFFDEYGKNLRDLI
jgi:predicted ATPase